MHVHDYGHSERSDDKQHNNKPHNSGQQPQTAGDRPKSAPRAPSDGEEWPWEEEWEIYAIILDRALFWLFLFVNLIVIVAFLAVYPNLNFSNDEYAQ